MKSFLSIVALVIAAAISVSLYTFKPKTEKKPPTRPVPIVKTIQARPGSERIFIEAYGTVIPARQIKLSAEVAGRVIKQNREIVPGGILAQNDFILQIDPVDYTLQVKERLAEVANAKYELELEAGRQTIAKQEWLLLADDVKSPLSSKSLALREPHLKHAKAQLDAAESRLAAAELSLKRTTILAPFNAIVLEEFIEEGQLLGQQTPIATLAGSDNFWIQVSIPVSRLPHIRFPDQDNGQGSKVEVIFEEKNGEVPAARQGRLFKLLGDLDPKGRMARILVSIDDPLNLTGKTSKNGHSQILLGSYVKVRIDAGSIDNVYSIPRQAVREGDRLWVVDERGILDIRPVDILWRRIDEMLVAADIAPGEEIITSRLQSPLPGMTVRIDGRSNSTQFDRNPPIPSTKPPQS